MKFFVVNALPLPNRLVVRDVKNVPQEEKKGKEITAVAVKNNKLLSFGDDDEEEESSNLCKDFSSTIFSQILILLMLFSISVQSK